MPSPHPGEGVIPQRMEGRDARGGKEGMMYEEETLNSEWDDGTMPECRKELEEAVVGHRIVNVEKLAPGDWWGEQRGAIITLDNGKRVKMRGTDDCCAYTEVKEFLLHPERVDHIITGVGTTDGYNTWHIYADMGDVLELKVGWSAGNPFYYGYGFNIVVEDVE
jgi:hypothetical protein